MDAPVEPHVLKIKRWLPYWAVLQADVHQTLRSWVYRTWVLIFVLGVTGYLLFKAGVAREAGIVQQGSVLMAELLRWAALGSITLVIVMTGGSISSERGTLADSVLSRGISRYQYFFAKWHSRLLTVLATFVILGTAAIVSSLFLFQIDLSIVGSFIALLTISIMLAAVATCGVTFSAITNSTMMGITVLWIFLYGFGFILKFVPTRFPTPDQALSRLPNVLQGMYSWHDLGQFALYATGFSFIFGVFGMIYFSRRDV